eukprot:scpid104926/ scgid1432/ 
MTSSLSKLTTITNSLLTSTADAVRKSSDAVAAFLSRLQGTVNRNLDQRFEAIQRKLQNHTTFVQESEMKMAKMQAALDRIDTNQQVSVRLDHTVQYVREHSIMKSTVPTREIQQLVNKVALC